ncbi:MAG: SurA N-terminal domain-containing protein [Acetobacteraceae bacterium]|nr:SurA N-terminal domain-containing protein [Acetobacteraceae bacterium]
MLGSFRRFIDTIVAKIFFGILVAAFAFWGVGDWVRNTTDDRAVAVVGGERVTPDKLDAIYHRQLQQTLHAMGTSIESTPEIRRAVAGQALDRLIISTALDAKAAAYHLAVPDEALRQAVFAVPAFKGPNGQFDRNTFLQLLNSNNYTEKRFLDEMRDDMLVRELILPLRADAVVPDTMTNAFYRLQNEQRVAVAVEVPFARAVPPPSPTDAQLQRFYENNAGRYVTRETRRVRAVVLSPETLAGEVKVSDDEIKAAYESRRSEFSLPEKRSVQVLLTQSEDSAKALAAQWRAGVDWTQMQAVAQKAGAGPVELEDATQVEFPAPELGKVVFATPVDTVAPPLKSALGWYVVKVVKITSGSSRSLADVTPELRATLVNEKAVDLLYDRANKVQDALAGGTTLENLSPDFGLAAVEGTLDAAGNTPEGKPAPIPGPAELRPALIQAIFQAKKGDTANLVQAPNAKDGTQSFYAFDIEDITPAATRPLAEVKAVVQADWTHDAMRHAQEVLAAGMIGGLKSGMTLQHEASQAGLQPVTLPPVGRDTPPAGVPPQLVGPLFSLKPGEATMIETPNGFTVAVLDHVVTPDPAKDADGVARIRDELAKSIASDIESSFIVSVRNAASPKINAALLDQMAQAD